MKHKKIKNLWIVAVCLYYIFNPAVKVLADVVSVEKVPIMDEVMVEEFETENMKEIPKLVIPEIELVNISSSTASSKSVLPEIIVKGADTLENTLRIVLKNSDGEFFDYDVQCVKENGKITYKMEEIKEDGRYTLIVEGTDIYGNSLQETCIFTVNRKGTIFEKERKDSSVIIKVHNYDDVKIISCMVNGQEIAYHWDGAQVIVDEQILVSGKNTITLETKDGAGNISSMEPWEIMVRESGGKEEETPTIFRKRVSFYEKMKKFVVDLLIS